MNTKVKQASKPLADTSTPEKWKAHQAIIAGQRDDNLPEQRWHVVRVVRQEFCVVATTRDRALAEIVNRHILPLKEDVESQTVQSEPI